MALLLIFDITLEVSHVVNILVNYLRETDHRFWNRFYWDTVLHYSLKTIVTIVINLKVFWQIYIEWRRDKLKEVHLDGVFTMHIVKHMYVMI